MKQVYDLKLKKQIGIAKDEDEVEEIINSYLHEVIPTDMSDNGIDTDKRQDEYRRQNIAAFNMLTIEIDEINAEIVMNMLEYYNLHNLKEAEKMDPFKDNSPYIRAIETFLNAYKKAKGE